MAKLGKWILDVWQQFKLSWYIFFVASIARGSGAIMIYVLNKTTNMQGKKPCTTWHMMHDALIFTSGKYPFYLHQQNTFLLGITFSTWQYFMASKHLWVSSPKLTVSI